MNQYIYHFGQSIPSNVNNLPKLLGNKGASLVQMSILGMPVPEGFTVSTEICNYYYSNNNTLPHDFLSELRSSLAQLEFVTGKKYGDRSNPLLLSVRSGSAVSMPGMMDTILNLGMNDEICNAIAVNSGNRSFALDCYRRFLEMYGSIVLGIKYYLFEGVVESHLTSLNKMTDSDDIKIKSLEKIIKDFKQIIVRYSGQECEPDPQMQLQHAIEAVLKSWNNQRAIVYRQLHNIDDSIGTAINVQSMVFGNMGLNSATGVVFTRCPSTGTNALFGEFLVNAQGEDVVSGTTTPVPIMNTSGSMQDVMPSAFLALKNMCNELERYYKDVQDIEFTVENGKLYLLQTRTAKRSAAAAVKIAVDMVSENIISKEEAILRIDPESLDQLLHTSIDYNNLPSHIAQGLPASPGCATGIVVFSSHEAESLSNHHNIILLRTDTSPEDIKGMNAAKAIVTARGGMTSHAAVVTRGMGKPCICGLSSMVIDKTNTSCTIAGVVIKHGDTITIDGTTGKIFCGFIPLVQSTLSYEFETLLNWADKIRDLSVRANAETIIDAKTALKFGAEGIGLCRTEHMFFDDTKILLIRKMIIAQDLDRRKKAIAELLPLQVSDFKGLFRVLNGLPINIRLLDPPLHEFLPKREEDKTLLAKALGLEILAIQRILDDLHENNPMLGHRGCRLGITYPEIYEMQVRAILIAIKELKDEGVPVQLELMIPFISNINELQKIKSIIDATARHLRDSFKIGTMIELPRAALQAAALANEVDFFSFGTNDLTQTTYGISRDDTSSFLPEYIKQRIIQHDPFVRIDEDGVGRLIKIATQEGKSTNAALKLGVCGEHAGNSESIEFFHKLGINYVSCSPYRIPIAKIAAARAKILNDL